TLFCKVGLISFFPSARFFEDRSSTCGALAMNAHSHDPADLAVTLFQEARDALFLFRPRSEHVIDANAMAQRLTGLTHADLCRRSIASLFSCDRADGMHRLRAAIRGGDALRAEDEYLLGPQARVTLSVR